MMRGNANPRSIAAQAHFCCKRDGL